MSEEQRNDKKDKFSLNRSVVKHHADYFIGGVAVLMIVGSVVSSVASAKGIDVERVCVVQQAEVDFTRD